MPSDIANDDNFLDRLFTDTSPTGQKAARVTLKDEILPRVSQNMIGAVVIMQIVFVASEGQRGDILAEVGSYLRKPAANELKKHLVTYADDLKDRQKSHHENRADSAHERCAVVLSAIISSVINPQEATIDAAPRDANRNRLMAFASRMNSRRFQLRA